MLGWIPKDAIEWGEKNSGFSERDLSTLYNFYRKCGFYAHAVDKNKPFFNDLFFYRFEPIAKDSKKVKEIIAEQIGPLYIVKIFNLT